MSVALSGKLNLADGKDCVDLNKCLPIPFGYTIDIGM
jgi:hypothetical protein